MFKKSDKAKSVDFAKQEISTLIGEGYHVKGDIEGTSVIRIDGKVTGNINAEGGIILGESGIIDGNLISRSAVIYGRVTGNIKSGQLELKKSGIVEGDIQTDTLEIELGARFTGNLDMKQKDGVTDSLKEVG